MSNKEKDTKTQDAFEKVLRLRTESIEGWSDARTRAKEVLKFVRHDPYTDKEKAAAEISNKPLLRYNLLVSKFMTIQGNEQANRRETKIIADYFSNEEAVKLLSDNFDYIREREDLERKMTRQLVDGLMYDTLGWIRRVIEMDDMGYLTFKYKLYDTFKVHPDKEFTNLNMEDCKYVVFDEWLTIDEIKHIPNIGPLASAEKKRWWVEIDSSMSLDRVKDNPDSEYKMGDRYLVCQLEERREIPVNLVQVEGEEGFLKLTDEEVKRVQKSKKKIELIKRITDTRIFLTTVFPAFDKVVLQDEEFPFPTKRLSLFPLSSFDWNMPKAKQPSLGYIMLDPAGRINKGKSQEVDYMIQKLGGSWHIAEIESKAMEKLTESAGQPNAIIPYKSLKNKAIRETGAADGASVQVVQGGVMSDMGFLDEISNVTQAMQGKEGKSSETGVLRDAKLGQSLISTNPYFEIKAALSENITRDFVELAPYVYFEDDRLLPVLKGAKGGLSYEMVNLQYSGDIQNDIRTISARAVLDEGENTPHRLEKTFNENIAFAQMLINSGFPPERIPFALIVKHSTIRDKEDWMKSLEESQQILAENTAQKQADEQMSSLMGVAGGMATEPQAAGN